MERIWLKSYPEDMPSEIDPDCYSSLVEVFQQCCEKYATNIAFTNLNQDLYYRDWAKYSQDLAAFFQQTLKMAKGERLALMLPNCLQYPIGLMAGLQAGLVIVNVNPLYTVPELIHQLNDSGATAIIVLANFANTLKQALPKTSIHSIIVTSLGDLLPLPKRYLVNFAIKYLKKLAPACSIAGAISWRKAMRIGRQQILEKIILQSDDLAFLQYTGGTTGVAKGAMLTHRNIIANLLQASTWVREIVREGQEVVMTALPLYHIFALMANCLIFMWYGARNILIINPRDLRQFISILNKYRFTAITGVNTLFNLLIKVPQFKQLDFSQLRICLAGGMAVQESVAEHWHKITGRPIIEAYGLTEASPAVTINPMDIPIYQASIGLPLPSTDISLRNSKGEEVAINVPGELWIKGPQVMQGYWQNPAETKLSFTPDGWLITGDIATIDEKGFIKIVDRKKDMILISGFNVYPTEIENVIAAHPAVSEVAVIGTLDKNFQEQVKAFIVKKDLELSENDIVNHCRASLAAYKVPKFIEFRDSLPKTNVGKISRQALKEK